VSLPPLTVVGGGLAGCEAAWVMAEAGHHVRLCEMRPVRGTDAHQTDQLAELVCSNSFRNNSIETAVGLLKAEMRRLGLAGDALRRRACRAGRCCAGGRSRAFRDRRHRGRGRAPAHRVGA
jgi:methylenetetrahydrofolate--tRNA-(uracil-5-)-methyltransferase